VPELRPEPAAGPSRAEQAIVVAMAATAIVGLTAVHGARLTLVALPAVALSLLWRPARVPRWAQRAAPSVLRLALAAVFLMRAGLTFYPVLDDDKITRIALVAGGSLVPLLVVAVLGTRVWSPARGAVPLAIALVAVASYDPSPRVRWTQVAEALLALAYLVAAIRRVEPPAARSRTAPRAAALLGFALVAAVLAVLIARVLPWAQPHVEDAAARLLNPSFPVGQAGFSANSRLGDIQRLALSRSVVLRVWTPYPRRLRGRVLTDFDGRGWQAPHPIWRNLPVVASSSLPDPVSDWLAVLPGTSFGDAAAAARPEGVRTRVAQAVVVADTLFAPAGVALARVNGSRLRADRFGVLEAPADPVGLYGLVHAPEGYSDPAEPRGASLAVPEDTDPRLRALAAQLAEGEPPPATKVERTLDYLAGTCRYSLDVGKFVSRQPVAEFVFEKKRGYCEYFASAAAVLLRLQGVPARYVAGFSLSAADVIGGHYVVRESDAHAWIEAWIPGRGWVEADPTPAADYALVHVRRPGPIDRLVEWLKARWADVALAVHTGELRRLAALAAGPLAVAALGAVALIAWRAWRRPSPVVAPPDPAWTGDPDLAAVMARLERVWVQHGHARPRHRGPLEHVRRLPAGGLPPALEAAAADVVAAYYDARYGGRTLPRETVRGLARRLEGPAA
jgi:transglutaminase-like putative cysteine protease